MKTYIVVMTILICLGVCSTASAQWVQTSGPGGGSVNSFAVSPDGRGGSYVYAGTARGVFLSTNSGAHWSAVSNGLDGFVHSLAVSGSSLFAGTSAGVFCSTDNGANWSIRNNGLPSFSDVLVLAVSGSNLLAGTVDYHALDPIGAVFLSTNGGANWTAVDTGLPNPHVGAFAVGPNVAGGTNLFAVINGGVFLSTDSGTPWTSVGEPGGDYVQSLAVSPADDGSGTNLFAGTAGSGVFLSTNNGASWTFAGLKNSYVGAFAVSPDSGGLGIHLFATTGNGGVYVSTNKGTDWTVTGFPDSYVYALAASSPSDGLGASLFVGTQEGVFRSTDNGVSWVWAGDGLANADVSAIAASGRNLVAGYGSFGGGGVSLSTDNGTTWLQASRGWPVGRNVFALAIIPASGGTGQRLNSPSGLTLFAGTGMSSWYGNPDGVYRSTDNGTSWVPANNGLPDGAAVAAFAVVGTNLFAAAGATVFLSTDYGVSWMPANIGLNGIGVTSLAVVPAAGGAGESNLFAGAYGGVFLSTDNGTNWTAVNNGLTDSDRHSYTLAVSGSNLFAGVSERSFFDSRYPEGVYLSTDNGSSWTAVNNGLPAGMHVQAFGVSGSSLFVVDLVDGGVFLSTDSGTSWTAVNTGLTNTHVNALAVSPNGAGGTNLFAGTRGDGVWRRPLSEMITAVKRSSDLPEYFSLEQNYPNPFNPTTRIEFRVQGLGFVSLKVCDLLGREVRTLVSEELKPGSYERTFDAIGLASGVYYYQLKAGEFNSTKKLLLLR